MMCMFWRHVAGLAGLMLFAAASAVANSPETDKTQASGEKYTLRYKFGSDQTLRWKVVHRARVDATVGGVSQTTESVTSSVKVWKVRSVDTHGTATFEQLVENVDMWQKLTGRTEVRYNSQTDKTPPVGFENVAKSIGVPLTRTTIDPRGKILDRHYLTGASKAQQEPMLTIPLPDAPVAVGETWSMPCEIEVRLEGGKIKKVQSRQIFTLESVKDSVATVRLSTQILTPVDDPAIEAQLMQRDSTGTVSFDVEAGRVVAQKMDTDKRVVGFRGQASSLHYRTQFTEELLAKAEKKEESPTTATPKTDGKPAASDAKASAASAKAGEQPSKAVASDATKSARRTEPGKPDARR